jgi:hypothetical protein
VEGVDKPGGGHQPGQWLTKAASGAVVDRGGY